MIQRAGVGGVGDVQSGDLGDRTDHHLHGILVGLENVRRGRVSRHTGGRDGGGFNIDTGSWNRINEFASGAGGKLHGRGRGRAGEHQSGLRRCAGRSNARTNGVWIIAADGQRSNRRRSIARAVAASGKRSEQRAQCGARKAMFHY